MQRPAPQKWATTYGALTHLAHGKSLNISTEAPPTILSGSSVIATGAGSNHRTLATFLWGHAMLEHTAGVRLSDDAVDRDLWRACELIENACPLEIRRLGVLLPRDKPADIRARILALGDRAATNEQYADALRARSRRPPPRHLLDIPDLYELETLAQEPRRFRRRSRLFGLGRRHPR